MNLTEQFLMKIDNKEETDWLKLQKEIVQK